VSEKSGSVVTGVWVCAWRARGRDVWERQQVRSSFTQQTTLSLKMPFVVEKVERKIELSRIFMGCLP
jgi:hypothetical protein